MYSILGFHTSGRVELSERSDRFNPSDTENRYSELAAHIVTSLALKSDHQKDMSTHRTSLGETVIQFANGVVLESSISPWHDWREPGFKGDKHTEREFSFTLLGSGFAVRYHLAAEYDTDLKLVDKRELGQKRLSTVESNNKSYCDPKAEWIAYEDVYAPLPELIKIINRDLGEALATLS